MSVSLPDHLLIVLIGVLYPAYATLIWFRRDLSMLEAGREKALVHFYRNNIKELWFLAILVLTRWFLSERSLGEIGFGIPGGWPFWTGVSVFALIAFLLIRQIYTLRASAEARAQLIKQLTGHIALIVPRSSLERRLAVYTSITAGICEEVLYRGFFFWHLMHWIPGYAAVAVSALVFGAAHIYQGVSGAIRALAAGVIFGAAYLLTGTLWIPVALHITIDITSLLSSSVALAMEEPAAVNEE